MALKAAGDLRGESETLLLLADAEGRGGDPGGAAARLKRVLTITEHVGNSAERARAFEGLAALSERRGDLPEALRLYRKVHDLHETVFQGSTRQQLQGLRLRFEVSQAARERRLYEQKNAELEALNRSLREADREKSRLLAELSR